MQHIKCVVVGDGHVGKTCLLAVYSTNSFNQEYVPTIFDNYKARIKINQTCVELGLWDTAGQEGYDRIRPLSYPETDVFLVCFSTANKDSYTNVTTWVAEVRHYCPAVPIILVGTKVDMRPDDVQSSERTSFVTFREGQNLARKINAFCYCECSSKIQKGVAEVFEEAVKAVIFQPEINTKGKRICSIL